MNDEKPLVSIVVRTKDRPELLIKALQSISAQTYRPLEVVLVNDGGCDLDVEELKNILGDVSLTYVRLEKNTGRAHAGNIGIENAKGAYVGFLDDDDEFYPEHVETLVTFLHQSDYKAAYADTEMLFKHFDGEAHEIVDTKNSVFAKDFKYEDLLIENYIPFNSLLFSKEAMKSVGRLNEKFELYEDWDFLIRAGQKFPFFHINRITAKYNQWSTDLQINKKDDIYMKTMHLKVINEHKDKITPEFIFNAWDKSRRIDEALRERDRAMKAHEAAVTERDNAILGRDAAVTARDIAIRERDAARIEKDRTFAEREQAVAKRDLAIKENFELKKLLTGKDDQISRLENIIFSMRETLGWKLLERARKLREQLLPQGKKRRKVYDFALKNFKKIRSNKGHDHLTQSLEKPGDVTVTEKRRINKNNFKVLFIVNHLDGGQRYRGFNMREYLKLANIESDVLFDNEIAQWRERLYEYDVIVLYRLFYTPLIREHILECREVGIPVIYDIDDYIFDENALPLMNVRGASKDELAQAIRNHRGVLDLCDCCIVPTERLAKLVKEIGKDTYVIRNGLCQELIDISESAYFSRKIDGNGVIKIGYFSGTTTHDNDFLVAANALLKLLGEKKNVVLCLAGHLQIDERFNEFRDRIETLPYVDWRLLPFNVATVDINIIPLEINIFTNSKSELKYFESALLRVPSVASPTESYIFAINNGTNGFIAGSDKEWEEYLTLLVEDRELRRKMGEEAYRDSLASYSPAAMSPKALGVYLSVIDKYTGSGK